MKLEELIRRGLYLPAAGYCRDKIGLYDFAGYLQTRLAVSHRVSQTQRILSEIPFCAAIMTNYEKFPEYHRLHPDAVLPDLTTTAG